MAVVNPHRHDSQYPFPHLAGVGVAFKVASAVLGDQQRVFREYCDLVSLGTVADVMPLVSENRVMVTAGIAAMQHSRRAGILALMRECQITPGSVTSSTVGYTLAPRINAAGRMGKVELAAELFMTQDREEAAGKLAAQLCRLNRQRQAIEAEIYADAVAMLEGVQNPDAIVLAGERWHQGVVGIVASRLAEDYGCPVFLICLSGDSGKASSRSYGNFPLFSTLEKLEPLLQNFGGHELAAGFTILREISRISPSGNGAGPSLSPVPSRGLGAGVGLRRFAGAFDHGQCDGIGRAGALWRLLPSPASLFGGNAGGAAQPKWAAEST